MKVTPESNFFVKNIIFHRITFSAISSIVFQLFIVLIFLVFIKLNLFHPLQWLTDVFSTMFSLKVWFLLLPIFVTKYILILFLSNKYIHGVKLYNNRFKQFLSIFTLINAINLFLYIFHSVLSTYLCINIINEYKYLYDKCSENTCIVEEHLFLIIASLWTGVYYYFKQLYRQKLLIKTNKPLSQILWNSCCNSIYPSIYFLLIYYFISGAIRFYLINLFDLKETNHNLWNTLFNIKLLLLLWMFNSIFNLIITTMEQNFEAVISKQNKFPIVKNDQFEISLAEGIAKTDLWIIQYLASYDLFLVASSDSLRRAELFLLSQPGSHPRNWKTMLAACLEVINKFIEDLNSCSEDTKKNSGDFDDPNRTLIQNAFNFGNPIQSSTPKYTKNLQGGDMASNQLKNRFGRIRNLDLLENSLDSSNNLCATCNMFKCECISNNDRSLEEILQNFIEKQKIFLKKSILKIPGVNYLFGHVAQAKLKYHLMLNSQSIMWIIQSLSLISVVSIKEDEYGILQNDLPLILITLVRLKTTVDKLNKSYVLPNRLKSALRPLNDEYYAQQILVALKSTIKRSLYNILNEFKPYINEFNLDKDTKGQLMSLLVNKD